jgi:hypothetical protein
VEVVFIARIELSHDLDNDEEKFYAILAIILIASTLEVARGFP